MPIAKIQTPNGQIISLEVPEGATEKQILDFVQSQDLSQFATQQVREVGPAGADIDVPTPENLAIQPEQQPDPTLGDIATGVGETALTLATGATGGTLGFAVGSLGGVLGELTGILEPGEGYQLAADSAAALTFEPRTEVGRQLIKEIAEPLSALPPVLGAAPQVVTLPTARMLSQTAKTSKGAIGSIRRVAQNASSTRKALADEIAAGNVNTGNIAKTLDADGTLITNPRLKTAIKLVGDEEAGYNAAINFEQMSPATKSQVSKMLRTIEQNKKSGDPVKIMENRPAQVVGDSIANRVLRLDKIRKDANKQLSAALDGELGTKRIKTTDALDSFIGDLNEAGLPVGRDGKKLSIDASNTILNFNEAINEGKLNTLLNQLDRGSLNGKDAHRLKRQLRELVSFGGDTPGAKASIEIENAIKRLAANLNDGLNQASKQYANANRKSASVMDELRKADKMLGNQLMIGDELAASKFGALSKRIGTNLASREQVIDLVDSVDRALNANGIRPKDDIKRQVAALSDLEKIFKVESAQAPFGFQSRIEQGALDAVTGVPTSAAREVGQFVLDRFRSMSEQDFNQKVKAVKSLLRESNKRGK
jgi:hypothetical protein